jgi:radical SAM protein with 4Fe4S-binding SPASM domain
MKPRLKADIFYATKDGKHLFLSPNIPDWLIVNTNGAAVLVLCDGTRSLETIEKELGASGTEAGICNLLLNAGRHGLLEGVSGEYESRARTAVAVASSSSTESIPITAVHLQLTNKCNYRCTYCYASSGVPAHPMLALNLLERLVDQILELSPHCHYELSGGEPLLYPHVFAIADYIKRSGNNLVLLTNGSLVNKGNALRIKDLFSLIKVSLDGPTGAINDQTRGKGTFAKARRGFDALLAAGANVLVSMTLTQRNIDQVESMIEEFGNLVTFAPMFHAGRGSEKNDLAITGEEYYNALASVQNVNPLSVVNNLIASGRGRRLTRCAMAETEISIADDGGVYPCQLLHEPQFCAGNIKYQSILDVYNSPIFRELRKINVYSVAGCSVCPIRHICGGACRARAYYENGSLQVSGEFCTYEQLAYVNGLLDATQFAPDLNTPPPERRRVPGTA